MTRVAPPKEFVRHAARVGLAMWDEASSFWARAVGSTDQVEANEFLVFGTDSEVTLHVARIADETGAVRDDLKGHCTPPTVPAGRYAATQAEVFIIDTGGGQPPDGTYTVTVTNGVGGPVIKSNLTVVHRNT